jgi:O-antigen/teichoic acid export membrane protein
MKLHGSIATEISRGVLLFRASRTLTLSALRRLVLEPHAIAVADQAVVSAASFLTTVLIGNFTNPGQLGTYSIAVSALASAYTVQGQLISLPYSIQRNRPSGTAEEHAGSSLALSALLASLVSLLLVLMALGLVRTPEHVELMSITWALAAVMPFALLRDFSRRFSFAHLEMEQALFLDTATSVIQLGMLGWLGLTGRMSAVTASLTLGASCAITAAGWLYFARTRFAIRAHKVRATMKLSWHLGKWLGLNQLMVQAQRFSPYWLCAIILGANLTGILSACMSFVGLMNPLVYGLNNILTQKSILAWNEGGVDGLRRQTRRDVILLAAALVPFCILALWIGEDVVHLLYRSDEYRGQGEIISLLVFATFVWALGNPASNALASMERAQLIFAVNVAAALFIGLLVGTLTAGFGLVGAAYGWLIGNFILTCALWFGFLHVVRRARDQQSILRVLPQITKTDPGNFTITKLGEGDHAMVYAVRSSSGESIWGTQRCVVTKIYKPGANQTSKLAAEQFISMARLHEAIDSRVVNGWTISSPKPLLIGEEPLTLVMTQVAGKHDLRASLGVDQDLTPEILNELGQAVVLGLKESWSRGERHGDLALQNVLYSVQTRQLSFIDPGTRECCFVCNSTDSLWTSAVLELGHILRDYGTDVRDLMGKPRARLLRGIFTTSAMRTYLNTIGSLDAKKKALNDIRDCSHFHLAKVLEASRLTRGFWRRPLTYFVVRRIDALLEKLLEEVSPQWGHMESVEHCGCNDERAAVHLPACSVPATAPECCTEPEVVSANAEQ